LKYAYIIKCTGFKKSDSGEIEEIYAAYDPATRSGSDTSGKKVKGTLGWVSCEHGIKAEIRMYDRLFKTENLNDIDDDFRNHLNKESLTINERAILESALKKASIGDQFQFERIGYFRVDEDSTQNKLIFNRTITLRDTWQKKA
jgi:glutaminyl-tRNA synthetase